MTPNRVIRVPWRGTFDARASAFQGARPVWHVLPLATVALVAVLLAVLTMARYADLLDQAHKACTIASGLDLTKWIDLCRQVEYQE